MQWSLSSMLSKFVSKLRWAGAVSMLLLILMLIVEGTWAVHLYHSWPFVILLMFISLSLIFVAVRDCRCRCWAGAASHIGLLCVLLGGMFGSVVKEDVKIVVDKHAKEQVAYATNGKSVVLPFALKLKDFCIDYYEDGCSPKQYTSSVAAYPLDKSADVLVFDCSVNHPARVKGWWVYQFDYDRNQQDFVLLQLVRDPWLPVVYLGFVLMVLGALIKVRQAWLSWKVLPIAVVLTIVFAVLSLIRIEFGTLVPALRSLWFFPHVLIYMVAYSLLVIALVMSVVALVKQRKNFNKSQQCGLAAKRLLVTVSSLLLIGMLCGAVWAKDAWGDYWMWDAKECWAAVTWLITIAGQHMCSRKSSDKQVFVLILVTFFAMQITWYGVNYLPSAQSSMHTYN